MARIRHLRRADGTLVPFRERKVADAIHRALADAGKADRSLAHELASVVSLFLCKHFQGAVPSTGDVRDVLGRVLRETGHVAAATSFEASLRERERLERELLVRHPRGSGEGPPTEDGREELAPWSRERLVAGLVRSRELPQSIAEEVAQAVEERLIRCGFANVSRGLLTEMVDHELFELGLHGARDTQLFHRVAREDVRALAAPEALADGGDLDRTVARLVLEPHALTELHDLAIAGAHGEGRLHVHGLDDPFKVERLELPFAAVCADPDAEVAELLLRLRRELEVLRAHTRSSIVLVDLVASLENHAETRADPGRVLGLLLSSLQFEDSLGRRVGPGTCLHVPLDAPADEERSFRTCLLDTLRKGALRATELELAYVLPRTGERPDAIALEAALDLAASRPNSWFILPRDRAPDQGRDLPVPLRVSLGRIALNLPLALADVQEGQLNDALAALEEPAQLALQAFRERFWLQREGRPQGLHGLVVRLGGPGRVQVKADGQEVDLDVWGLPLAIELLQRRGVVAPGQVSDAAARLLAYLDYQLGAEWDGVRFRVRLGGCQDYEVRRRLFAATESWAERFGRDDLQAALRAAPADVPALPVALPLLSERNAPLLEGAFAERLGPGLALSLAVLPEELPAAAFLERLARETRLGLLSLAPGATPGGVLEVQEELFS